MEPRDSASRRSGMGPRLCLLVLVAVAVTSCTGSGDSATSPASAAPSTAMTSPKVGGARTNLVGYPTESPRCPTKPKSEPERPQVMVTGKVRKYLLCPLEPGVWGLPFEPTAITPTASDSGESFSRLDSALRLPDEPVSSQGCPATAQKPRTLMVVTTQGRWLVHLPVDRCGMYLPQVKRALRIPVPL
jgi:hypothetical protein